MAVLDKLCLRGIRSFGPNEEEQVKFTTPLTLFLGQNGCGKTTIIESLKFALTGELPANTSSGSGFVNDPKLSSKSSTKGYVKVRFIDGKGDKITVAKFVEVTNKNNKLTFKNTNPMVRWEDGKSQKPPQDIGGRCAEIDQYCVQKLNVSKAILNNVIFCHQENSAWPLDEGGKLKEKFDEIFGATEYNKVVEKLRKDIKERKNTLKVTKAELEGKKEIKKNVERLKDNLGVQEGLLVSKKEDIEKKREELEPLTQKHKEILELEEKLGALQNKLTGFKKTLEANLKHQQSLKKHLETEFEGTDEELKAEIENFTQEQSKIESDIKEKEQKRKELESKLTSFNKELQSKQVKFGKLKAEEDLNKKRCEERDEQVEKAKVKCNVQGETVDEVIEALKNHISNIEKEFENLTSQKESEQKKLQEGIDEIRSKHASAKASQDTTDKTISGLTKTINELKRKLDRLKISDSQIKIIEERIEQTKERLEKRKAEFDEDAQQTELDELKADIQTKEQTTTILEREHKKLQQNFVAEQNIDRENTSILGTQGEIDEIKQKHEENFKTLFPNEMPEGNFAKAIRTILTREESKVKKLNKNISEYEKKLSSFEAELRHLKNAFDWYQEDLQTNENRVEQLCKNKNFEDAVKESYNRKEKLQKEKGTYRSCIIMYEAFIEKFEQEKPCCPVCESDFSEQKEKVGLIISKLKTNIIEVPSRLADLEKNLKLEEDFYNKLQQLKPIIENIETLKNKKIKSTQEEITKKQEKIEEITLELGMLKNEITAPQNMVETCKKIGSDAAVLDRLILDLKKSQTALEKYKASLVQVPSNRTLEETEAELRTVKADLATLRKKYETKKELFDQTKDSIQALNANLQVEVQKQLEAQKMLQERPLLETQLADATEQKAKLEEELVTLKESVKTLKAELQQLEKEKDAVVKQNKKELEEQRSEVNAQKRVLEDIQKIIATITKYENSNAQEKMTALVAEIDETKEKISTLEETKETLNKYVSEKKQELASQESRLRGLNDNEELRRYRKEEEEVKVKVEETEKELEGQNIKSVYQEKKALEKTMTTIRTHIDRGEGEIKQIQATIGNLNKELNRRENKMAYKEFLSKYYELRVNELAIEDLNLYTANLEKAILMFHKERMVQINKTIRDLWRNIYKGNDIDYIEIQTEDSTGGGAKRRTYNYKVVEVKKGVELEMRGRCSAGQRVLACLVIRMALAETFSGSCGILALDEPTTNLDRDNIISLSDALSRIITAREKQKNFQLLIITHDEDFLTTLTRDQSVSSYYRVQRNPDGFSEIVRQSL